MARVPPSRTRLETYPWRCVLPTRYGDLDPNQHINNVAFTSLFEEGRVRLIRAMWGPLSAGPGIVAASLNIAFLAEALYPVDITMGLGISRIGRTSWTVVAGAFDEERCLAVCEAVMVCVGPQGPSALSPSWRDAADPYLMDSED